MLFQVVADVLHVTGGGRRLTDAHSGAEHLLKSGVHLLFFDELAPVGVGFAFSYGGVETRILVQQPQGDVLQQFARVGLTVAAGNLRYIAGLSRFVAASVRQSLN